MIHLSRSLHPAEFLLRLKRFLLNRRGDRVHSPYTYFLIHRVLSNQYPYYCFKYLGQGENKMTRRRYQLIFRLLHHFGEIESLLVSAPPDNILPQYIKHTGKVKNIQILDIPTAVERDTDGISIPQVLILESWDEAHWHSYTIIAKQMYEYYCHSAILISTPEPRSRKLFRELYSRLQSPVVIDIIDLQLLVFDTSLTAGYYKAYY